MKDKGKATSNKENAHQDQSETPTGRPKHIQEHMDRLKALGFRDVTEEKLGQTSVYFIPRRKS